MIALKGPELEYMSIDQLIDHCTELEEFAKSVASATPGGEAKVVADWLALSRMERAIFFHLWNAGGCPATKEDIARQLERVFGVKIASWNALRVAISHIRKKAAHSVWRIESNPRVGYRLVREEEVS